ncbi:hypothetical protein QFC22_001480 [Naganishia vaughanmartiniae]|uniref:Uncharacterized protein n=1 Tax=Naganishia vaughanmartiniae TaxID=1424756 RepID=A0ACC2XJ20_9TREE|nr:hypothetical protein QFC22_001480 [Naganishia vaughanmartiniae]
MAAWDQSQTRYDEMDRSLGTITRKVSSEENVFQPPQQDSQQGLGGLKASPSGKIPTKYRSSNRLRQQTYTHVASEEFRPQVDHSTPERVIPRGNVSIYPSELSKGVIPPYPYATTSNNQQNLGYQPQHPAPSQIISESHDSQLESLESLLSRAGYKETRVFTPEAEKVKAFARKVYKTLDAAGHAAEGSGLRHQATRGRTGRGSELADDRVPDEGDRSCDSIGSTNSPLKRWGNAVVKPIGPQTGTDLHRLPPDNYHYIEPALPISETTFKIDGTAVQQAASSSLRNLLATDDQRVSRSKSTSPVGSMASSSSRLRSRSPDPYVDRLSQTKRPSQTAHDVTTRHGMPSHAYDVFDQAVNDRIERVARAANMPDGHEMSGTHTSNSSSSGIGRKRRVLNRVELDFVEPSTVSTIATTELPTSLASSMASVSISDPSFGNDTPAPDMYDHLEPNGDMRFKTISIDDVDEEEFEEVARVEYSLSRHIFPPRNPLAPDNAFELTAEAEDTEGSQFDPAAYEAEDADEVYSVEYGDQEEYEDTYSHSRVEDMARHLNFGDNDFQTRSPMNRNASSDIYSSDADDTRSTISETDYGEIHTASIIRRTSVTPTVSTTGEHELDAGQTTTMTTTAATLAFPTRNTKRTIIPGSPPHVSTLYDSELPATTITTRLGGHAADGYKPVSLRDSMTARKLRHAISTPAFGQTSTSSKSSQPPPVPALPFRAPTGGQPEGWLSKVGRVWSGSSSLVSNTSKATLDDMPKRSRAPVALSRIGNAPARPASPRIHRAGAVVCNTQEGEDLPPVAPALGGKAIQPSAFTSAMPKRRLRTMFSLQNLKSAVVQPVQPIAPITESDETPLSPTLSPRLNWDARDLWDPQPLGGFNALYPTQQQQYLAPETQRAQVIYPEPDFTKSFFYSPATPPTGPSKSSSRKAAKQPPLQPKRQQSIKSLRAALEKDAARLKVDSDIPPVPAIPQHLSTPQKNAPTPPMIAISSPNSCEAGLPPKALSLEGEDWEGGSFESRKERERRLKKSMVKRRKSGLRHSKTAV